MNYSSEEEPKNKLSAEYFDFHKEELAEFIYGYRQQGIAVNSALEKLAENEYTTLVKAFVSESGRIEEKYSKLHKGYLGVLKKINTKWYDSAKVKLDDKIIDNCAKEKLNELEESKKQARQLADKADSKRYEYFGKYVDLEIGAAIEISNAKKCKKLRKTCQTYMAALNEELKEKLRKGDLDSINDLRQANRQAKRDLEHIDVLYEKSNIKAESIQGRLLLIFPAYVKLDVYATAIAQQTVTLENAYEFYYNLFYDLKDMKSQKLIEFKQWNDNFDKFQENFNQDSEESSQKMLSIFGSTKKQTNLSNWKEALHLYKKAKGNLQDKKLEALENEQQRLNELDIRYNKGLEDDDDKDDPNDDEEDEE